MGQQSSSQTKTAAQRKRTLWSMAREMAEQTPESRNRYVDFLRAVSIFLVILGHWVVAAPFFVDRELQWGNLLELEPVIQWATWVFQVMPVFFMVGGYSHRVSWQLASSRQKSYGEWLGSRLQRLAGPVLPLLLFWVAASLGGVLVGFRPETVKLASQMALIPLWFLAVYVVVAALVPWAHAAWERFGIASFWGLAVAAMLVDLAFFALGWRWLGWSNYLFVWLAVHQLGFAWRDGEFVRPTRNLAWAVGGLLALVGLVTLGPYPRSMVGWPGMELSNTLPPKVTLLALGVFQGGTLLLLERPARRWLARLRPWTATVLVNGMIMTVYLWHLTAMIVLILASYLLDGFGMTMDPGAAGWWLTRPLWLVLLVLAMQPFLALFSRFERPRPRPGLAELSAVRIVLGTTLVAAGLAAVALFGIGAAWTEPGNWLVLLPFVGMEVLGIGMLTSPRSPWRERGS